MTAMLPPPPPPPPADEDASTIANQPTFIEQWLEKERQKSPPTNTKKDRQEFFDKQCLFPRHIPAAAMCNIEPMIGLISHHVEEYDDGDSSTDRKTIDTTHEQTLPSHRTALDDVRKIASLCATYKSKAVSNHKEFQYKRAIKLKEKKQREEAEEATTLETEATGNVQSSSKKSDAISLPSKPAYHPEYTPLSLPENFLMSKIHSANYNLCIANAVCPERTRRLLSCWKSLDPRWVKLMQQNDIEEYICLEEREDVERCVGLGVQRVMKDILG